MTKSKTRLVQQKPHAGHAVHASLVRALTSLGIRQGLLEAAKLAFANAVEGLVDHNYVYAVSLLERLAYDATVIREAERAKRRQTALERPRAITRCVSAPAAGSSVIPRFAGGLVPLRKLREYDVWIGGKFHTKIMARNGDDALDKAKGMLPAEFECSGSHVKPIGTKGTH